MTTTPDYARLIERLEKVEPDTPGEGVTRYYRNPDGPGAAATLRTLLERSAALKRERDTARRHTSNLLARIHRDGGHYEGEHGTSKAVEDADFIISEMLVCAEAAEARVKELEAENARLRERQAEADRVIEPFAEYLDDGFDLDYEGRPLPDSNTLGWVYLTLGHLRAARAYRDKGRE